MELDTELVIPFFLASLLLSGVLLRIIFQLIRGTFDTLHIKNLVIVVYGMLYGFSAIDRILFRTQSVSGEPEYLTAIMLYAIIGLLFFELGYSFTIFDKIIKIIPKSPVYCNSKQLNRIVICLYIICIGCIFILELNGQGIIYRLLNPLELKNTADNDWWFFYVQWGLFMSHVGFWSLFCHQLQKNQKIFNLYLCLLFLLTFFLSFCLNRYAVINFMLPIMIIYHYHIHKLKLHHVSLILLFALSYFFGWDVYRNSTVGGDIVSESGFQSVYDGLVANLDYLDSFLQILSKINSDEYQHGATFFTVLFKPIPRSVWAEKPLGANSAITEIIDPAAFDIGYSRAASVLVEAYINFGWFGIIIIMFLVGCICRLIFLYLKSNRDNPWNTLFYAIWVITILTFIRVDTQIASTFAIYYLVPLFFVIQAGRRL